jgi:NitT/TauT family transport system substrate-binding protein
MNRHHFKLSRREWLRATTASAIAFLGSEARAADPPPETRRIRIQDAPAACFAPLFIAEALLKAEGFSEVEYVKASLTPGLTATLAAGQVDIVQDDAAGYLMHLDAGSPLVVLGGIHTGCWELLAQHSIRSLLQLKGRRVAAPERSSRQAFLKAMLASVGLDPARDVVWVDLEPAETMRQFEAGQVDAMLGFMPEPQELRARGIGHVLISTLTDRPWSQYFCCLAAATRDFVRRNPIATKRALRALVKATDLCASQPELAARTMLARAVWPDQDRLLEAVKEIGFRKWRDFNPDDTMRFWALRLREMGIIKGDPKALVARGTDWRFIAEIKRELKA